MSVVIERLKFAVTFPATGKTISGDHTFGPGMTAITGPNGQGKTLRLELIRYALFGTEALRGNATDYKDLSVELWFLGYKVFRKGQKTELTQGGAVLAVGAKAVNAKIPQILGFGRSVFDIACSINQNEIEALSAMTPSDRKRMIESTVGLTMFEDLSKWASEQGRDELVRAEVLTKGLVEPVAPETPENYVPSGVLKLEVDYLRVQLGTRNWLGGWLENVRFPPVEPEPPAWLDQNDELVEQQNLRDGILKDIRYWEDCIKGYAKSVRFTEEQLVQFEEQNRAYEKGLDRTTFLARLPLPTYTLEQITISDTRRRIKERDELRTHIENMLILCPHCGGEQPNGHVDNLRVALSAYDTLPEETPDGLDIDQPISIREIDLLSRWKDRGTLDKWEKVKDAVETSAPPLNWTQIEKERERNESFKSREWAEEHLTDLRGRLPADVSDKLRAIIAFEGASASYALQLDSYSSWIQERDQKQIEFDNLSAIPALYVEKEAAYRESLNYEAARTRYDTDFLSYQTRLVELTEAKALAETWKRVRKALDDVRTRVKAVLLPGLNKVASYLMASVTQGTFSKVEINEDWNITVAGQPIHTLSGSEKAAANLAVRLGLGQVLTQKTFPVLLADEIDASMDEDRAEATAETIRSLSKILKQVILVTHKDIEADHQISL